MKIFYFMVLVGVVCGCMQLPHFSMENIAVNRLLADQTTPKQWLEMLSQAQEDFVQEHPQKVERLRPLTMAMAGLAEVGAQDVELGGWWTSGAAAYFNPMTSTVVINGKVSESITRVLAHEVIHSGDKRLCTTLGGGLCLVAELGLKSLSHKAYLEAMGPSEMYAEYGSQLVLYRINRRLTEKGFLWDHQWLLRPGTVWETIPTEDSVVMSFPGRSWDDIVQLFFEGGDPGSSAIYIIGNLAQVIMEGARDEAEPNVFEDSAYVEFLKTCDWASLGQRVDEALKKYSILECYQRFKKGREKLVIKLGDAAALNKK